MKVSACNIPTELSALHVIIMMVMMIRKKTLKSGFTANAVSVQSKCKLQKAQVHVVSSASPLFTLALLNPLRKAPDPSVAA